MVIGWLGHPPHILCCLFFFLLSSRHLKRFHPNTAARHSRDQHKLTPGDKTTFLIWPLFPRKEDRGHMCVRSWGQWGEKGAEDKGVKKDFACLSEQYNKHREKRCFSLYFSPGVFGFKGLQSSCFLRKYLNTVIPIPLIHLIPLIYKLFLLYYFPQHAKAPYFSVESFCHPLWFCILAA